MKKYTEQDIIDCVSKFRQCFRENDIVKCMPPILFVQLYLSGKLDKTISKSNIYKKEECIYEYCPHPNICKKNGCQCIDEKHH